MKYVISDIHGEYELFLALMRKIGFSASDELYVSGDFIDKGDGSVQLMKWLSSKPNVHCIRGNHEEALLSYYYSLMRDTEDYGEVLERLKDYIKGDGQLLDWDIIEWLEALPYYIEADSFICVHAGVPLNEDDEILPLSDVPAGQLLYNRRFKNPDVLPRSEKCVFFGHTATECVSSEAAIIAYKRSGTEGKSINDYIKVHLDTGVFTSGRLGCFCIDSCTAFYVES